MNITTLDTSRPNIATFDIPTIDQLVVRYLVKTILLLLFRRCLTLGFSFCESTGPTQSSVERTLGSYMVSVRYRPSYSTLPWSISCEYRGVRCRSKASHSPEICVESSNDFFLLPKVGKCIDRRPIIIHSKLMNSSFTEFCLFCAGVFFYHFGNAIFESDRERL